MGHLRIMMVEASIPVNTDRVGRSWKGYWNFQQRCDRCCGYTKTITGIQMDIPNGGSLVQLNLIWIMPKVSFAT